MELQQQLLDTLPVFDISENMENVIGFFDQTTCSHVAVMENNVFVGVLPENDLACFETSKTIQDYRHNLEHFFVTNETSWLDVLEIFARNEANIVPVLDMDKHILGYYDLTDIVGVFIETPFFTEPGGILIVEKGMKDYSMSEIGQIVESNNAKVLGAFITDSQNDVVQITLKISSTSLNEITQTFRRYNYNIIFGNSDDQFLEDLKKRSAYLDKYLNV
ncbi:MULTISPECIES: CBS domain-containing protein [unclassified Croceitalea]|uniref:CBS domain-containing protein n=1 Tax=unclassified Croceitalea TaxID=2632280 RepID=UPI0030D77F24